MMCWPDEYSHESHVDIVQIQLQIAQGATLDETALSRIDANPETPPPPLYSISRGTSVRVFVSRSLACSVVCCCPVCPAVCPP